MDDDRIRDFEAMLKAARDALAAEEAATAADRAPVELDQQSVGRLSRRDALQVQAMALEQSRRRATELRRIEAALGRIASGDYGFCLECGEEIPEKRLRLDPTAPFCVDCAGMRRG